MNYICPVCGFDRLPEEPEDHVICPSCGTQFGYHDVTRSHSELRSQWVAMGMPWRSRRVPKPDRWSPTLQLSRVIYPVLVFDVGRATTKSVGQTEVVGRAFELNQADASPSPLFLVDGGLSANEGGSITASGSSEIVEFKLAA